MPEPSGPCSKRPKALDQSIATPQCGFPTVRPHADAYAEFRSDQIVRSGDEAADEQNKAQDRQARACQGHTVEEQKQACHDQRRPKIVEHLEDDQGEERGADEREQMFELRKMERGSAHAEALFAKVPQMASIAAG